MVAGTSKNEIGTLKNQDSSQESINKQILAQLSILGDRLATLEENGPMSTFFSTQNKDRISYNQLSHQWMSGFCRAMREEQNQVIKDCMLDYVINLLDDAQDFSWSSAKASHVVLLCRMEQGGDWWLVGSRKK